MAPGLGPAARHSGKARHNHEGGSAAGRGHRSNRSAGVGGGGRCGVFWLALGRSGRSWRALAGWGGGGDGVIMCIVLSVGLGGGGDGVKRPHRPPVDFCRAPGNCEQDSAQGLL